MALFKIGLIMDTIYLLTLTICSRYRESIFLTPTAMDSLQKDSVHCPYQKFLNQVEEDFDQRFSSGRFSALDKQQALQNFYAISTILIDNETNNQ